MGTSDNTSYTFSIPENISTTVTNGIAKFDDITIYQGTFLKKQFTVDGSLDQKFILDNSYIDTSTIVVYVKGSSDTGLGIEYSVVDNILNVDENSEIYLIQEVQDEKYQLIFGDNRFGKKLENNAVITVTYIITDGKDGNGASNFAFSGTLIDSSTIPKRVKPANISITTIQSAQNGADIEAIDSIKYFAPRNYSSQNRAVTSKDYESIIKKIYPDTESVSIVGGEELDPPEYGNVIISIKPKNGTYVSEFNKSKILSKLKQYSISGINQRIADLKLLYVEIDSSIYYNASQVTAVDSLKSKVQGSLNTYSKSVDLNSFGGRFKYSKILQIIDNTDNAITSNITKVRIRRDLQALVNQFAQYELCFGNQFHYKSDGYNIKSTGFKISGETDFVYLTDTPNKNSNGDVDGSGMGTISIVKPLSDGKIRVIVKSAGTVNYGKGEILLGTVNITSTELSNNIVEIQAYPESNDIVGLKELYLYFDVSKSTINMVRDVITSGDDISGVVFNSKNYYTSSYSNGKLKRG